MTSNRADTKDDSENGSYYSSKFSSDDDDASSGGGEYDGEGDDSDFSSEASSTDDDGSSSSSDDDEWSEEDEEDQRRIDVPVGRWRDSLWSLFDYGLCHASVLHSCCCTFLASAQASTRLELDCCGRPTTATTTTRRVATRAGLFRSTLYAVCCYYVARVAFLGTIYVLDPNKDSDEWIEPSTAYYCFVAADEIISYGYYIFMFVLVYNIRHYVRNRYAIPDTEYYNFPPGYEDLCCSIFCPCLVIAQVLRHTADYDRYRGRFCTDTGIRHSAPAIV